MTLRYIPCIPGGFKGEEGVAGRDRGVLGNSWLCERGPGVCCSPIPTAQ